MCEYSAQNGVGRTEKESVIRVAGDSQAKASKGSRTEVMYLYADIALEVSIHFPQINMEVERSP